MTPEERGIPARLKYLTDHDKKRHALAIMGAVFLKYWRHAGIITHWPDSVHRTIYYLGCIGK